jgi:hypothetical protein
VSAFRDQLADAVGATEVLSRTRFSWLGQPSEQLPDHVEARLSDEEARGFLVHGLTNRLYADFYCHGRAGVSPPGEASADAHRGDPGLVEALSAANGGSGCWESGWSLLGTEEQQLVVERNGLKLRAGPHECRAQTGGEAAVGDEVDVLLPNELLRSSPGFYMALVEKPLAESGALVRLYWNLGPAGAVPFVHEATRLINERAVPARLKVANHPSQFDRCDAGVVYLPREAVVEDPAMVAALYAPLRDHLEPGVPALTRSVAPGLGLADDPGAGQSYGLHRCGLIAEGMAGAHADGLRGQAERVAAVVERLCEAGLDPDRPYLSPGTTGDYAIPVD